MPAEHNKRAKTCMYVALVLYSSDFGDDGDRPAPFIHSTPHHQSRPSIHPSINQPIDPSTITSHHIFILSVAVRWADASWLLLSSLTRSSGGGGRRDAAAAAAAAQHGVVVVVGVVVLGKPAAAEDDAWKTRGGDGVVLGAVAVAVVFVLRLPFALACGRGRIAGEAPSLAGLLVTDSFDFVRFSCVRACTTFSFVERSTWTRIHMWVP